MDIAHSIPTTVKSISFSFLTSEDVRRISVKQIVNPILLDDLNRPNVGGLYDPMLGPSGKQAICGTCRLTYFTCPGHFGHIELPAPVYHPLFMVNMFNVLRATCMFCHSFKMGRMQKIRYIARLRLLEHGLVNAALGLDGIQLQTSSPEENKMIADDIGYGDEEEDESVEEFEQRLNLYVAAVLRQASSSKRDDYKDGLVYQLRKNTISQFLKAAVNFKKCANCAAFGHTFRKEGHTKIIEYDLTAKHKEFNHLNNTIRPNVLVGQTYHNAKPGRPLGEDDMDVDEDEGEGDDLLSDTDSVTPNKEPAKPAVAPPRAANGMIKTLRGRNERVMAPEESRAHLRRLFAKESTLCSLLWGRHGPHAPVSNQDLSVASADMFFMDVLPVPPTRFRPPAAMGDTLFEHPQNELLANVIKTTYRIRDLNLDLREVTTKRPEELAEGGKLPGDRNKILGSLLEALIQLQVDVNSFIDSGKNPTPVRQGKLPPAGVKQGLEKKEGLFRKNMMGKRVNYAARSVISPDVNIETNEIGIPPVFARKLTFPEPVTPMNLQEMRQAVINGPKIYPGATIVQFEDGSQQFLDKLSVEQRTAIANQLLVPQEGAKAAAQSHTLTTRTMTTNKKVFRHLRDGDILILNRQPTLHKPSMMAHKARVLQGEKTIRMHYANCNSYNADFDGDEMNIHFAQSQVARSEAMFIANTDNQYLVPTSGNPLRGLIQDHVVAGVWMTNKATFFTREDYFQIIYGALRPEDHYTGGGRVITLPPAIWKPKPLWTGKQIISTILKNISPENARGLNLYSNSKILNSHWGSYSYEREVTFADGETVNIKLHGEEEVIFCDGDLVCGVLDKSQFGATAYGLVHSVFEIYSAEHAGRLLSILSRLFTKFLQHRGFTCRMDDLLLTPEADKVRNQLLDRGKTFGHEAAVSNFPALASSATSEAQRDTQLAILLEEVLRDDSKMNGLDVTVKKKMADLTQSIASASIPHGLHRKFPDNHMQTMVMSGAKGSAVNARQISCGLGQTELEGRRVPVMVSGKTLPSFKPLETAAIAGGYVASRFLTGLKPQEFYFHCMAGREGLIDTAVKTSRSGYLQRCLIKHLEGLCVHYDNTVRGSDSSVYQFNYGGDGLDVTKQMHLTHFDFAAANIQSIVDRIRPRDIANLVNDSDAIVYMKKALKHPKKYPPALSVFSPTQFLGSTSEKFAEAVNQYVKKNTGKTLRAKKNDAPDPRRPKDMLPAAQFRTLMYAKYLRCLAEPGEAVGLLASQGVGEPSTQMTLNTFHFAGHGAANVTLGIPRLREIVMTASTKPKTPTMTLPIAAHMKSSAITKFCKKACRLKLSEIVDYVSVQEKLVIIGGTLKKLFTVIITFFPKEHYKEQYLVTPVEILDALGYRFSAVLRKEMLSELKKLGEDMKSQASGIGKGRATRTHDEAVTAERGEADADADVGPSGAQDDVSEVGDGDADDAKRERQTRQLSTYDSDESDDEVSINSEYLEAQFDENDIDEEANNDGQPNLAREKSAWKDRVDVAGRAFMERCPPWSTSFDFSSDGSECKFQLEFTSESPKLLLVGIIERACLKTVVREIPGISRCLEVRPEKKSDGLKFMTEGSNFAGLWEFVQDEAIMDAIESNDIHAVLCTYGVELARATIIREISSVFAVYNIKVDFRHLTLIADYMTFDGGYKPFSRGGISTHSSVLLKASYETTATFLSDATLHGDFDTLTSPSGSIVMGRPSQSGTGIFDVVTPIPMS